MVILDEQQHGASPDANVLSVNRALDFEVDKVLRDFADRLDAAFKVGRRGMGR